MPQIPNSLFSTDELTNSPGVAIDAEEVINTSSSSTLESATRNNEITSLFDEPAGLLEDDETATAQEYERIKDRANSLVSPSTSEWSQNNYPFVKDEKDELSTVERFTRGAGALAGGAVSVFGAIPEGLGRFYNIGQQSALNLLLEPIRLINPTLAEEAKNYLTTPTDYIPWWVNVGSVAQNIGEGVEGTAEALTPDDPNFVEQVLGGTGQLASQIAIALATGGTSSAVTLFGQGVDITGEKLDQTRGGKPPAPWEGLATTLGGAVTGVTEKYGLDNLLARIPANFRNKLVRILVGAGSEASQEILEEVGQNLVIMGFDPKRTPQDPNLVEQGTVAAVVGGIASSLIPSRKKAVMVEEGINKANETMSNTRLANTTTEEAVDYKDAILRGSGIRRVYIDPGALLNYAKGKEEGGVLLSNLRDPLTKALENNTPVVISRKQFARHIFGTDHYNGLSDELYYNPSAIPSKTAIQELQEHGAALAKAINDEEQAKIDKKREIERTAKRKLAESIKKTEPTLRQRTLKWIEKFNKGEDIDLRDILLKAPADVVTNIEQYLADIKEEGVISKQEIAAARVRTVNTELQNNQFNIDLLNQAIIDRQSVNKPIKRLQQRLNKLEQRQKDLNSELELHKPLAFEGLSKKQESELRRKLNPPEAGGPISLTQKRLEGLNVKATKETSTQVRKTFARVRKEAAENFRSAQTILGTFIEKSDLSLEKKGKYLATLRGVRSVEDLQKRLPELQTRILEDVDKQRKAQAKGAIQKLVKKAAKSGKKGGLTPALNDFVQQAREVLKLTKAEAAVKLDDAQPDSLINNLLALKADPSRVNANDIEALLLDLEGVIVQGQKIRKASVLYRQQQRDELKQRIVEAIGKVPTKRPSPKKESFQNAIAAGWLGWNGAWHNKLQHIFESSDTKGVNQLLKDLSLFKESRTFDKNFRRTTNSFVKKMADRVKMSERQLLSQWQRDNTERVELDNNQGSYTKAEIRKRLLELENQAIRDHLYKNEGFTQAKEEAMRNTITPFDKAMMESQLEFYNEYYERINEVYRRLYGLNLPSVDNYVPIKRDYGDGNIQDDFVRSINYVGGVGPSALKSRQPNKQRLKVDSDVQVMQTHMHEMEYFIAYAEKVQDLKNIFEGNQNELLNSISDKYGRGVANTIRADLDYFANRGRMASIAGERFFVQLMRNFTFAQLGAKPQIGLKQLASFSAFAQDVSTGDFVKGLVDFATNPRAAWRLMNESDFFSERGLNIDNDFRELRADSLNGKLLNFMGRNPNFTRIMMLPIRYGDKGAILIGGYAHVKARIKAGATKEEALDSFARLANKTQQSQDPDQQSELQRTSALYRVLSQFMSSANAITRAEIEAIVEYRKGRIDTGELAKRLVVHHLLIPNTIMFIANGFAWDGDDQLTASIVGSFTGLIIFGDVIEFAARSLVGDATPFEIDARHPLELFQSLIKFAQQVVDGSLDLSLEDVIEGSKTVERLLEFGGALSGIPLETLYNALRGGVIAAEGDVREGGGLMLGYSPYALKKGVN